MLLSPEIRESISPDTIDKYFLDYSKYLENCYDNNKIQLAVNEQNYYNYQLHERARIKAEENNATLVKWIFGISCLCLLFAIAILYYKNKVKKTLLNLHIALNNIDKLNKNLLTANHSNLIEDGFWDTNTGHKLREALKNKLLSIYNENADEPLSSTIFESEVYKKLTELIKQEKALLYDEPIWNELEDIVIKASPNFKHNLQLLTQSRLTAIDFHTALLIKCHIQPKQMAILLGRTKGTIVSRRETLSLKIFGEKMGTKVIDGIIRLL